MESDWMDIVDEQQISPQILNLWIKVRALTCLG